MTLLRLLPDPEASRDALPDAWLLPGGDEVRWLRQLAGWRRPGAPVRLARIPTSDRDLRPCGVLVLDTIPPVDAVGAVPFRRRGRTLYLPQSSRLWPPVDDAELEVLLPGEIVVWHPGVGPVSFAERDLLRLHDLLAPPPLLSGRWVHAHPGERPARLVEILVPPPPGIDVLIENGRDGIGGSAADRLPPAPDEAGSVERGAKLLRWALGRGIDRLAGLAPGGADSATWIDRLQQWARATTAANDPRLDDARHRELQRLLKALADDPDQGLRYALPLAGDGAAHRGIAPPGTLLTPRSTDFSGAGRGGRPIDAWSVDPRVQAELRARYLELARREIALGRHRRAAYIHATLLGDLASAAAALEQGMHHREAAAIQLERLKRPLEAARTLERGGLLDEAARLFAEHGDPLAAAGCHLRRGRLEDARRCWRTAVEQRTAAQDALGAAEILAGSLEAPDEALALLAGTWPGHPQAGRCLVAAFDLFGRLGRHGAAGERIERLAGSDVRSDLAFDALAHAVGTYPDAPLRALAADAGRRLVGRQIADGADAAHLLRRLHALAPADRLLAGDAMRWSKRTRTSTTPSAPATPLRPRIAFRLDGGVRWGAATSCPLGLVAAGWIGGRLVVSRATWSGAADSMHWQDLAPGGLLLFMAGGGRAYLRIRSKDGWAPAAIRDKPANDRWGAALAVGTFGPIYGTVAACAAAHDGGWWLLMAGGDGWKLVHARSEGAVVQVPLPDLPEGRDALLGRIGMHAVVAVGGVIGVVGIDCGLVVRELGAQVLALVAHPGPEEPCVVAITTDGVVACWSTADGVTTVPFAGSHGRGMAGFTRDGTLVISATGQRPRAYRCAEERVKHVADGLHAAPDEVIAVAPGPEPRSIILVTAAGAVSEWLVPEPD